MQNITSEHDLVRAASESVHTSFCAGKAEIHFTYKVLEGTQAVRPSVVDISLSYFPFELQPLPLDIYGAAEPDALAVLDSLAKRIENRSPTSACRARRRFSQQLSHSIWTCIAQANWLARNQTP